VPGDVDAITDWIWARTQEQARSRDETERAWEVVESMIAANPSKVQRDGKDTTESGQIIAREGEGYVSVMTSEIRRCLDGKYDADAIMHRWREQGRCTYVTDRFAGRQARALRFKQV
jgi:hypothetical protein